MAAVARESERCAVITVAVMPRAIGELLHAIAETGDAGESLDVWKEKHAPRYRALSCSSSSLGTMTMSVVRRAWSSRVFSHRRGDKPP